MEMKKGDNLTKQQIKIFRRGNKPDQQAMNIYKSETNKAKTSLTSRLRTATEQKTNEEEPSPTSGLRTAKQQIRTKNRQARPAGCEQQSNKTKRNASRQQLRNPLQTPHHSDQRRAPTPLSPPSKPPPQSPHKRDP